MGGGGWVRWVGGRVLVFWVRVGVSQTVFQNRTERHRIEKMFCFLNIYKIYKQQEDGVSLLKFVSYFVSHPCVVCSDNMVCTL